MVNKKKLSANELDVFRSRHFDVLLYCEWDNFLSCLAWVASCPSYFYIEHNLDQYDSGDKAGFVKKAHYHCVIVFKNPQRRVELSRKSGIPKQFFEPCQSFDGSLQYLTHLNDIDKVQYSIHDVVTNDFPRLRSAYDLCSKASEEYKIIKILRWIDSQKSISHRDLLEFCLNQNIYDVYRRNYPILESVRGNHNFDRRHGQIDYIDISRV